MWDVGADTSAYQLEATYTFEDMFNNLWAWRQTRVGNAAEPYERHPLRAGATLRHATRPRALRGLRQVPHAVEEARAPHTGGLPRRETTLWGALGDAAIERARSGSRASCASPTSRR